VGRPAPAGDRTCVPGPASDRLDRSNPVVWSDLHADYV